ncbi:hypothetical protein [Mycoplasmopsis fermentans]|uniref:hypothetical protein n=1 Tax=Mycoplasmopsis fermentans TaxID=2115 RepID=UPI000FEED1FA|nr:hypothetical protein [Mycoplasmopsis fermentans]RMX34469.1 hypothetical protein MFI2_0867 [Mycoplasmopsis fermentans MF-I2]RMX34487.1 hypothetical protein MFI1_0913 [Mycoplasmopsis fermentans MF-I1]
MSFSREKIKNCSEQELKNIRKVVLCLLNIALSYDINKAVECLTHPKNCEHYETHEQFLTKLDKIIKEKVKDYKENIKNAKELFKTNSSLIDLMKLIEFKIKLIEVCVESYKCDKWNLDGSLYVGTFIKEITTLFNNYLNHLFDIVIEELEKKLVC